MNSAEVQNISRREWSIILHILFVRRDSSNGENMAAKTPTTILWLIYLCAGAAWLAIPAIRKPTSCK
jgi:hypothetical protein